VAPQTGHSFAATGAETTGAEGNEVSAALIEMPQLGQIQSLGCSTNSLQIGQVI